MSEPARKPAEFVPRPPRDFQSFAFGSMISPTRALFVIEIANLWALQRERPFAKSSNVNTA